MSEQGQSNTNGEHAEVFSATLAANGQITVSKKTRDALNIEQGDIIFLRVTKVIAPDGRTKIDT